MMFEKFRNIEFRADLDYITDFKPAPSSRFMPEEYKKMPSYHESDPKKLGMKFDEDGWQKMLSVKKCVPFLDALTMGYIIPTDADIFVTFNGIDPPDLHMSSGREFLNGHFNWQFHTHKDNIDDTRSTFLKYMNPWSITTDRGYSCMFIPPLNHENRYFNVFSGVVDTDDYNAEVHLPFTWKGPVGEYVIPAGTPIIQVIPFKRESYQSVVDVHTKKSSTAKTSSNRRLFSVFKHGYRKMFWKKKFYK